MLSVTHTENTMPRFRVTALIDIDAPTVNEVNIIVDRLDEMIIKKIGIQNLDNVSLVTVEPVVEEVVS